MKRVAPSRPIRQSILDAVPAASCLYEGPSDVTPGDEGRRLNPWLGGGNAPTNGLPVDLTVQSFCFTP